MISTIKMILKDFLCKEFIYKDFNVSYTDNESITLTAKQTSVKGYTNNKISIINIWKDLISLSIKNIYEDDYQEIYTNKDSSINIDNNSIKLESYIIQDYQGTHTEKGESIHILTDEVRYNSLIIRYEHRDYTKEVNEEMKYKNNILYIVLKKIMPILLKHVIKMLKMMMMMMMMMMMIMLCQIKHVSPG